MSQSGFRTTYSVATPTVSGDSSTLQSTGTVELLSSDGGVVRTFSANIKKARGGGAAGAEGGDATKRIATGSNFACAIASDGWVYCWGEGGAYKNLGNGKTTNEVAPVAISQGEIPVGVTFTSISASNTFTCGVASDGKAYCWGSGATGGGSGYNSGGLAIAVVRGDMPVGATIKQVSAGNDFACAVASDGKAYCWGSTTKGRLGDNTSVNYVRNSPVAVVKGEIPVGVTIKSVSAGEEHACAIASNDKAYCWGAYRMGKLGIGINDPYVESYARPMAIKRGVIPTTATIQSISAGSEHTCAIASNSKTYCWGYNSSGQLGIGSGSGAAYTPMAVSQGAMPANTAIRDISTSTLGGLLGSSSVGHSCAVTSIGGIYCWGSGVGIGVGNTSASSSTPAAVMRSEQNPPLGQGEQSALPASIKIQQVSNGFQTTCVIASDDNVYCWGGLAVDGSYTSHYGAPRVISKINMPTGVTFRPPSSTSGAGLLY